MISEERLSSWAAPPSEAERQKCDRTATQIRNAIDKSEALSVHSIAVFAQGSYRNNTNIRHDSDVDVCVLCTDVFFSDFGLSDGLTKSDVGIVDSSYSYSEFKSDVQQSLEAYFSPESVSRGNKAFDIHESSTRVDADVVACFEHRRYMKDPIRRFRYLSGTELRPDTGSKIVNWPNQNYENGVAKNRRTGRRFKGGVRILKRLRNEMAEKGKTSVDAPSYLLECLAWNVPDVGFADSAYRNNLRYMLAYLFNNTRSDSGCSEWGEVNELKYLFRQRQPWTRADVHTFVSDAWDYVEFD